MCVCPCVVCVCPCALAGIDPNVLRLEIADLWNNKELTRVSQCQDGCKDEFHPASNIPLPLVPNAPLFTHLNKSKLCVIDVPMTCQVCHFPL